MLINFVDATNDANHYTKPLGDVTMSMVAVRVEPGRTATYDCAAISVTAELLSDFVQQKQNDICSHTYAMGFKYTNTHFFRLEYVPTPYHWLCF